MTAVAEESVLRGRLQSIPEVRRYMLAGNATLTVVGKTRRYTWKFQRPPGTKDGELEKPIFVKYLYGDNNEEHYRYFGCIWPSITEWRWVPKRQTLMPSQQITAVEWVVGVLNRDDAKDFQKMEVWHEGRCGRCGRKLTVPESIRHGFGPECIQYVTTQPQLPYTEACREHA